MKKSILFSFFISLILITKVFAQGTFSIVAVDSVTGEVGSAGASCVDYVAFGLVPGRIGDPIPGIGVINTQAATNPSNQANARTRMLAGDSPQQIIAWLIANDVQGDSTIRQYGVVDLNGGSPRRAAHTGSNCSNYKNHVLGPNYSIQGNILLAQHILDSMEARFLNTQGDLACKLMAALQGAKTVGADVRCLSKGSSALYAFVKVAQTTDSLDNPSLFLGVKTRDGDGIEPVDSLQILFDDTIMCNPSGINNIDVKTEILIYPNPASTHTTIYTTSNSSGYTYKLFNLLGKLVLSGSGNGLNAERIDLLNLNRGFYLLKIYGNGRSTQIEKLIVD